MVTRGDESERSQRRRWPWVAGAAAAVAGAGTVALVLVILAAIVVAALVVAGVVAVIFFLVFLVTSPVSNGPAFVEALAADNDRAAYDLLCEETRDAVPFERFQARIVPEREVLDTTIETEGSGLFEPPDRTLATFHFVDGSSVSVVYESEAGDDGNLYVCRPPSFPGR